MSGVQKILFAYTNNTLDVSTETDTGSLSVSKDTFVGIGNSLYNKDRKEDLESI